MPDHDSNDLVDRWTILMDEWAMVSKELDVAMALGGSIDPAMMSQWQQHLDEVRQRQDAIKQRIDEIISEATAVRTAPVGDLIVGQISSILPQAPVELSHQQLKNRS